MQLILLAGVFGVLVVILVVMGSIARSLIRLEQRTGQQETNQPVGASSAVADSAGSPRKVSQHADFMSFLAEDAGRRNLPKREQFAAYRKWRRENGLSWQPKTGNRSQT